MKLTKTAEMVRNKVAAEELDSCAILVYKNGDEVAVLTDNVNMDTYFDVASMGKILVTSTLILKAVDKQQLSLDNTLGDFFDYAPADKKNITIKQLLTHTSGILRYPILPEEVEKGHDAIAKGIMAHPLAFEPGTMRTYSCNGMLLLGYILEKIYGKDLEVVFEEMLKPALGYTRSRFNIEKNEPNAAICYRSENVDALAHPWDDENIRILQTSAGSGGQFFTPGDIKRFANAVIHKSSALYSEAMFDLVEQNYVDEPNDGQGLGWFYVDEKFYQRGKLFPVGSFGHTGYTGQSMFFNRKLDMYVVMLTNATRFSSKKRGFCGPDYENDTCRIRTELHNAIFEDLKASKLL